MIRRIIATATLSTVALLAAGCSTNQSREEPASAPLTAQQARALAFDDCNYIIDHLAKSGEGSRARALSYCLGVSSVKFGMN
ncbi:hypothetical protein IIE18_10735 [Pseudomonas sp. V1]|uniref:hypothetical protein n=1 Tax=Pseudomonas arcuscaelestis TaxID=2710591 RepID=UPI00193F85BF|nr:hypothetical protein [Pseudomonas arcuscaelestis]MBM3105616.1 hypothetical protein [Pseudomonas arcuscaelestis]